MPAPTAAEPTAATGVETLLAAFDLCVTPVERAVIARALARTGVADDRVRACFVRMLEDDPENGAHHLAELGDPRALPDVARALDRLLATPIADCEICHGLHLNAVAAALVALGGDLSEEQAVKIQAALERADAEWIPLDPGRGSYVSRRGGERPGRNDPCHCGSGKKYKRCHLEADERGGRH